MPLSKQMVGTQKSFAHNLAILGFELVCHLKLSKITLSVVIHTLNNIQKIHVHGSLFSLEVIESKSLVFILANILHL